MSQKENIFRFNHINKSKTKEEIQEIKELYKYYHFKFWVYQKAYKHFKVSSRVKYHNFSKFAIFKWLNRANQELSFKKIPRKNVFSVQTYGGQ